MSDAEQLTALARVNELLEANEIEYWLFGGWAVDLHAGLVTRTHDDLDIAVWAEDHKRIATLLAADGWAHSPEQGEDGYTGYQRGSVRLELAFLARAADGQIYTPLREGGRAAWPDEHSAARWQSGAEFAQRSSAFKRSEQIRRRFVTTRSWPRRTAPTR